MIHVTPHSLALGRMVAAVAAAGSLSTGVAFGAPADGAAPVLEEIVVTSERVETKLSATPVSTLVVSGAMMEDLGVKNVESLIAFVPGLKIDGNDPTEMRLSLRGALTTADTPSTEQSVALFIDGVYLGHTGDLTSDFFDIERVEVLRGPQGTLWGRNVVGGAVSVVTKNPTDHFESELGITAGNYDRFEVGGRVAGPISDALRGQLAFKTRKADGHTKIVDILNQGLPDAGKYVGAEDSKSVRGKLQLLTSDSSDVTLAAEYTKDDVEGPAARNIVAGGVTTMYPLPRDRFTTWQKIAGGLDRDIYGASLSTNWETSIGTLSTITAYRNLEAFFAEFSYDAAPVGGINLERDYSDEMFSQEVRLAGKTSALDWQAGVYYYYDYAKRTEFYRERVDPRSVAALFRINPTPGDSQSWRKDTGKTNSWAVFGQATWHATDWLNLTLGARYTEDDKAANPETFSLVNPLEPVLADRSLPPGSTGFKTHVEDSWSAFTPKATVDVMFNDVGPFDSLMSYVTYAEGFKSGGFETRTTLAGSQIPFELEESKSYEIGVKARFWDSRAQLHVAAYTAEYTNMQGLEQPAGSPTFVVFTSDADVDGVETELVLAPLSGLQLSAAYAWTDGRYQDGSVTGSGDISGNRLPQTPRDSVTLGASYTVDIGSASSLNFSANYGKKGGVHFNPDNRLESYVDPKTGDSIYEMTKQEILDARIAYTIGAWEVAVWGKNLLQDNYLLRAQDPFRLWGLRPAEFFSGMNLVTGTWGAPRTYGISFTWRTK